MPLLDALTVSAVQFFFAHRGESLSCIIPVVVHGIPRWLRHDDEEDQY
jgi:hypothetical protein